MRTGNKNADSRKSPIDENLQQYYIASQWKLMWRKFKRHKLALIGGWILIVFYFVAIFADFLAPYSPQEQDSKHIFAPPQKIRFVDSQGRFSIRPFVYRTQFEMNAKTWLREYREDKSQKYYIRLFHRSEPYPFLSVFTARVRLIGVDSPAKLNMLGTDRFGRDLLSRMINGSRVSLTIGLIGISASFILGCLLGGISGYYGGTIDMLIQRVIDFLISLPSIPLWMALAASLPADWPPVKIYFAITIILSIMGWCDLARVVRGKLLELREADYVVAARVSAMRTGPIITRHLLPGFLSYLVVSITLAIPGMILGETALSFIGIGMREPAISWGVLLQAGQKFSTIALYPWLLLPGVLVVIVVLAFNFLGDGLRDAADPYK